MPHAEHSVVFKRPVSEVFAYVIDGTTGPSWRPSIADIRFVAGTTGQVGARYEQGMRGPGGRIAADYELTEVVPDRRIVFSVVAGPARPEGRYEFAPSDGGTRVSFALDWRPKGIRENLMAPMVARTMPKEVAALDDLKRVLEAGR